MNFTERDGELTQLTKALDRASVGQGSAVIVSGEAGIGKSSLLDRFAQLVEARARVLVGTCEDLMTPRPLGPFRDMARGAGVLTLSAADDRDGLIDTLLAEMSFAQRPAVVIVEDVQWADQATLDVLRFLVRRVGDLPAMLVVSFRGEELADDHPLLRVIAATPPGSVLRLPIGGLSDAAVTDLAIAAGLDPASVVAAVGGNPFYLSEVLAAPTDVVPISIRHAVLSRVTALPLDCREAVELLSVMPSEAEWALLDRLLPSPAVLDPAESRGILASSYSGVHFRHELARRAVEASLGRARRLGAHRRVLEALAVGDAEPSRLVHHAVAVGDDVAIALHAERASVEAAKVHGHREVVRFSELALDHGALSGEARARLHLRAGTALYGLHRFGPATDHVERAIALCEESGGSAQLLGDALLLAARIRTLLARPEAARAAAARAVDLLEPLGPSASLALAYSVVGSQDAVQSRFSDALAWTGRALATATAVGAEDVVAHALNYRGVARSSLGDPGGLEDLQRSIEVAHRLRHGDYEAIAANNLAVVLLRDGDVARAERHLRHALDTAAEQNLDVALFRIESQLAACLMLRDRWDEAERRVRSLLASGDDLGAVAVNPLAVLARILARRGDPSAAALCRRAWDLAMPTAEPQKIAVAAAAGVELLWLDGAVAELRARAGELLDLVTPSGNRVLHGEVLRYLARSGHPVQTFPGCPSGYAAGIAGRWQDAAEVWAAAGNSYERALELCWSTDQAATLQGLEILDRLGAVATAAKVRAHLRRSGIAHVPRGPRPSTRESPALLTRRQRDVLDLLLAGMTNAEIASRLVLSPRTVDNHVAAVLQRIGVNSRREVAPAAAGLGLIDPGDPAPRLPADSGRI